MPTIGRVIQGGPMIRIREDGETAEQAAGRAEREAKGAREAGDDLLARSWEFVASQFARLCDEPRFPPGAFNGWARTRDFTFPELRSWGFSEAEAWSIYHGQWHSYLNPLMLVVEQVVRNKAHDRKPLLAHERRWLRDQMLEQLQATMLRKGRDWFVRHLGQERAQATEMGTLSAQDIEATAR